jgi:GC-rich sequence DNA-binding factor
LERTERENLAIQRERYEIVSKRRFADDADDVALFTGASVRSIYIPRLTDAEPENSTEDRLIDGTSAPGSDFAEARAARRAERGRRVPRLAGSDVTDDIGSWTDDELPSDTSADLADAVQSLRTNLASLFEDVKADDFRDPNLGIRKRFEEWRSRYTDDYMNAFGGLALVGVWEFWARVEMAMWNPFEVSAAKHFVSNGVTQR